MECLFLQPQNARGVQVGIKKILPQQARKNQTQMMKKKIYRLGGYFFGGGIISPSTSRFEVPAGSVFVPCTL